MSVATLDGPIQKIDSHVHLWDAEHTPPLLERNHLDAVIVVQGACLDTDTDYLLAEADRNDWIAAVTAWVCLDQPERTAARLDALQARSKFRGVRHLSHNEPDHWLIREPTLECLAILEERDLILEVPVVFPRHFDDVVDLAERFPHLRIVIDHLGKPPIGTPEMAAWATELGAAAEHANVFAKVSGLNTALPRADWTIGDLQPCVEVALDCFGPERLMCGSDWPVALLNGDYDRVWALTSSALTAAAPAASDLLLGGNAQRIYRLDNPLET